MNDTDIKKWLDENAPDCGDNSCMFGGRGRGGMRTNGGCRCLSKSGMLPLGTRLYFQRLYQYYKSLGVSNSL